MQGPGPVAGVLGAISVLLVSAAALQDGENRRRGQDARVESRNELGVNPLNLVEPTLPRIGAPWEARLDCRSHGAGVAVLTARDRPLYGVVIVAGEILIDVFSGVHLFTLVLPHAGQAVTFRISLPDDPSLVGFEAHVQGLCTGSPGPRLSNALDLFIGR